MSSCTDKQIECRMIELLKEQKDLIPEQYLHQSGMENLTLGEAEFSSLFADAERQVLEGSSFVLCCGEKINSTIRDLLSEKFHANESFTRSGSLSHDVYEEIFKKFIFKSDECHLVRESLEQDRITPEKREEIISCLSSPTGIGNLFMLVHKHFMLLMITLHMMCVAPL